MEETESSSSSSSGSSTDSDHAEEPITTVQEYGQVQMETTEWNALAQKMRKEAEKFEAADKELSLIHI